MLKKKFKKMKFNNKYKNKANTKENNPNQRKI